MYKLLVVDDEYNIRDGIINVIPWEKYDIQIVGEASNGVEAVDKVYKLKPDIVITDIYMDEMNGIDFTESIKKDFPDVKVIILSGYDEFEHAKKAIDLKVSSYLLKPILPDELLSIVQNVTYEIDEERELKDKISTLEEELKSSRDMLVNKFINDLIEGRITSYEEITQRAEFLDFQIDQPHYACIIFNLDGYFELRDLKSPKQIHILLLGIKNVIEEIFKKRYFTHVLLHNLGNVVVIIGKVPSTEKKQLDALYGDIEKIKENIKTLLDITVTAGIGRIFNSILDIRKSYIEASRALDQKVMVGKDSIINIEDTISISGNSTMYPLDEEMHIIESLNEEDIIRVRLGIERFFQELQQQNYSKDRMRVAVMQLFAVVARKLMDMGIDIYRIYDKNIIDCYSALERYDTLDEIKNWVTNIIIGAVQQLEQDRQNNVKSVIRKAQEYILQNFSNSDISLISIAEQVYLNPAYFSKLYKKETGESYVEFITRLRMEEAKKLLKESNARISDIGNAVGYPNAQYFCTVFKKIAGFSPAEYREGKG